MAILLFRHPVDSASKLSYACGRPSRGLSKVGQLAIYY